MSKIYLGADHNGFEMKDQIKRYLEEKGHEYEDLGNLIHDPADDYPLFADLVAKRVASEPESTGFLLCGSSHGVCFTANKTKGIRAAEIGSKEDAISARAHTNCNIMCLSGWKLKSIDDLKETIDTWLNTEFSTDERHRKRVAQVTKIEEESFK